MRRKIEALIQKWVFYNPWLEPLVWYKYYTPDARAPEVPISQRAQCHLQELRENGVTMLHGFESIAEHIERTYFPVIEGHAQQTPQSMEKISFGGRDDVTNTDNYRISFKDPVLAPLLLDPDVCGILYNYYQRQPFYREQPWVIRNALIADLPNAEFSRLEISAKFHTDCYRQITMMLLVSDLAETDTHLEYAVGSHRFRNTWKRYSYQDEAIAQQFPIMHCVGPKGTLIIMDAGSGFHRGTHKRGTVRKTLQCVITAGHYFPAQEQKMTVTDWPSFSHYPQHVRRMLEDLRLD
ncbi:MAG: hypothetical protein JSR67_10610 [Proteobacteria bacterium]|nr:hypothetical protein [Pseudomonadota bacterium]